MEMNNFLIQDEFKGERIDKFLADKFNQKTRGEIIKMIKSGNITVDDKKIKPSYIIGGGEKVGIMDFEIKEEKVVPNKNIDVEIIEKNDDFIIINKSIGVQVHPSYSESKNTLVNGLIVKFPEILNVGEEWYRPGIVHRLDKNTSGLMIIARNQESFEKFKVMFKDKKIQKTYFAIVFGIFGEKEGIVDAPIARATSFKKQKIAFGKYKGNSKESQTQYRVLGEYLLDDMEFSLVELKPKTGRMHQIRVHMAHIGHPLVGDLKYYTKNEKKKVDKLSKKYDFDTFYLHAGELEFNFNGQNYKFSVKYPGRFEKMLNLMVKI